MKWFCPNPVWDYVQPENIPLDIIYEDEDILLVNKKQKNGLPSRTRKFPRNISACTLWHYNNTTNYRRYKTGLVHRLDKNTSGIIIIGKTEHALTLTCQNNFSTHNKTTLYCISVGRLKIKQEE